MNLCRWRLFLLIGFLVIGGILYANALDNSFHFDDVYILYQDELHHISHVSKLWTTASHISNIPDPNIGNNPEGRGHYRPLVLTTYLFNYSLGGLNPTGYHIVNLLIHILTSFLVALVIDRLTGRLAIGAFSGLLFLVHPFNSEAVNYITARSSQMYALFYLWSFYAYIRWGFSRLAEKAHPAFWLSLTFLFFILSMLSKEMAVTLPVTLFLYEWLTGPETGLRRNMRRIWIPLCITLAVIVSYFVVRKVLIGAVLGPGMGNRSMVSQLATQGVVLVRTLGLILYPANLTIDHKVEIYKTVLAWPVIGACIVLVGLLGLVFWWGRSNVQNKRLWAFLLVWFFVVLSPLVIIRLNAMLQENRVYLAMVGLVGLAGIGLIGLLDWAKMKSPIFLKGVWTGIVVLMLIYIGLTVQRNRVWQNDITLWTDAVQKEPYSSMSCDNLGLAHLRQGHVERAYELFRHSWTINPANHYAIYHIGIIMAMQGRMKEANAWYTAAFRLNRGFFAELLQYGKRDEEDGRWDVAVRAYRQAVYLWPDRFEGHYFLADALFHEGHREEAVLEYRMALQKSPDDQALRAFIQSKLDKADYTSGQKSQR